MERIKTREQLKKNIMTLDKYLREGNKKAKDLILDGICFVVYRVGEEMRFAPSRFVGYIDNDIAKHEANDNKDGGDTNEAIDKILKCARIPEKFLNEFLDYCGRNGIEQRERGLFNYKRKFWEKVLELKSM